MAYPLHPLSLGQQEDIFHSPGACSFSSQGLCVEGEKVPTRWMRFKLGRKCRGKRRQSRGNNDERPGSAVVSHWCRHLCDQSLLPLAVKMAKGRIYVILPQSFTHKHFCALGACWLASLVYCAFAKDRSESTVIPLNLYQDLDLIMFT